ncbi:isochorismatase family cysteine hydrolase [Euzebya pacifica]|uniref:cysteine hydrolase family protein n=1 Tax=Euzebya pacifica TaxID=1608957 RepID=UPI0030FC9ED5
MRSAGPDDALIVIDLQRKYAADDGPFAMAGASELVARTADFADAMRERGVPVIWVTRELRPGLSMGPATASTLGESWFSGPQAELDDRLRPRPGDVRVVKPRQSSFYGTDLDVVLRTAGVTRVLLTGVTTNICVQATAQDARARDYDVVVLEDLTASLPVVAAGHEMSDHDVQKATLATIAHAIGTVVSSQDLLVATA